MKLHQGPKLKKLPTGQHVLLNELWKKHGGMRACAKLIGVPEYLLNMWRRRGAVPLKRCQAVSKALNVPLYAINFVQLTKLLGEAYTWEGAVVACRFSAETEEKILKAKVPK